MASQERRGRRATMSIFYASYGFLQLGHFYLLLRSFCFPCPLKRKRQHIKMGNATTAIHKHTRHIHVSLKLGLHLRFIAYDSIQNCSFTSSVNTKESVRQIASCKPDSIQCSLRLLTDHLHVIRTRNAK